MLRVYRCLGGYLSWYCLGSLCLEGTATTGGRSMGVWSKSSEDSKDKRNRRCESTCLSCPAMSWCSSWTYRKINSLCYWLCLE